jgi:competence protein ComEA
MIEDQLSIIWRCTNSVKRFLGLELRWRRQRRRHRVEVRVPGNPPNRQHDDVHASLHVVVGILLVALVCSALITSVALIAADRYDRPPLLVADAVQPTLVVQIDGAVATPGVYSLPAGARLDDAVSRAGGLTADADVAELNLAARIGDGERITVPNRTVATPIATEQISATEGPLLVNLNSASVAELDQLPGIGPVLGERIVAYRERNGPFSSLDEVVNVEGISTRLLDDLRPYITLDD